MTPEAVISGTVFDEAGDAIAGAEVQLFNSVVKQGRRVMSGSGSINANTAGAYRIGQLRAGRYMVCAHSSQMTYPVGGGGHIPYGETCSPAFPLQAGEERREDFHLPATPGVHVRGTISGAPPRAHIVVEIGKVSEIAHDGKFDLAGVVPGSYTIEGLAVLDGATRFTGGEDRCGGRSGRGERRAHVRSQRGSYGNVRFAGGKPPESLKVNVEPDSIQPWLLCGHAGMGCIGLCIRLVRSAPTRQISRDRERWAGPVFTSNTSNSKAARIAGDELTLTESDGHRSCRRRRWGKLEGRVADARGNSGGRHPAAARTLPPQRAGSGRRWALHDGQCSARRLPRLRLRRCPGCRVCGAGMDSAKRGPGRAGEHRGARVGYGGADPNGYGSP